jgi:hypothetical protein
MKKIKTIKTILVSSLLLCSTAVFADVAVIVNPANGAALSDNDISRLFLGKLKKFPSGDKATPVNLKFGSATRNEFEKKVLKKSSSQIKAYWSKLVFSGKGKPPKELASDSDIIALVAGDAGAVAYVDAASVNDSVKVIKTF